MTNRMKVIPSGGSKAKKIALDIMKLKDEGHEEIFDCQLVMREFLSPGYLVKIAIESLTSEAAKILMKKIISSMKKRRARNKVNVIIEREGSEYRIPVDKDRFIEDSKPTKYM